MQLRLLAGFVLRFVFHKACSRQPTVIHVVATTSGVRVTLEFCHAEVQKKRKGKR
jgi:hypothetical protein